MYSTCTYLRVLTLEEVQVYRFLSAGSRSHEAEGPVKSRTRRELHDKMGYPLALWPHEAQFCSLLGTDASCLSHLPIYTNHILKNWLRTLIQNRIFSIVHIKF